MTKAFSVRGLPDGRELPKKGNKKPAVHDLLRVYAPLVLLIIYHY